MEIRYGRVGVFIGRTGGGGCGGSVGGRGVRICCSLATPCFARDTHRSPQAISRVIKHSEGGDEAWQNKQSL